MGYQGLYSVTDDKGKKLGRFAGWTPDEAIKRAAKQFPDSTGLVAKYAGHDHGGCR
jgi:hypothetical protein